MNQQNYVQLLRHATLVIQIGNLKIMVDPMLSDKDGLDPVQNCGNEIRIPMVALPITKIELKQLLEEIDAVFITHTHRDHWDIAAQQLIDKNKLIFCQPADTEKIKEQGFKNVRPVDTKINWEVITIHRTGGQHGTGEIGKKMGEVSGFVLSDSTNSIYIAGDTIWCDEVKNSLSEFKPKITIVNAGGAQFLTGGPITMIPEDIMMVNKELPETKIIAVHMDTVNHCFISRKDLANELTKYNLDTKIQIPKDGEIITL